MVFTRVFRVRQLRTRIVREFNVYARPIIHSRTKRAIYLPCYPFETRDVCLMAHCWSRSKTDFLLEMLYVFYCANKTRL